ncbi:MAG TPA: hypothetical protein EYG51_24105 [Pseudomonadales bacterium]|nr:hypothetical protein [Pseudomonadales bacterium]
MLRAALEHDRTFKEWRRHHLDHILTIEDLGALNSDWRPGVPAALLVSCVCDQQVGRFRKGQRARTQGGQRVCPRSMGDRTRQEQRSDLDFREWLQGELGGRNESR